MKTLEKIDKNFSVNTKVFKEDAKIYSIDKSPFKVYGVFYEDGLYRRLPQAVSKEISTGVYELHSCSAGGRVRFATDSPYVAIHVKVGKSVIVPHSTFTGSAGFDLYADSYYEKTFIPPIDLKDGFESIAELGDKKMREITINFPRFSEIKEMYISLSKDAVLKEASPYGNKKPIVYYGSSITQGGCASRPGMSYQSIISRRFNYDFINLGFSGSALGEESMANYIKTLDMSLFVYDYDYNAAYPKDLEETHEKMFKIIREENPNLPIIIMSRPKCRLNESETERLRIIERTYKNAVDSGDKNVYFIDGKTLMALCSDEGTVDGCHPTDFGFASMAEALGKVIEKIDII